MISWASSTNHLLTKLLDEHVISSVKTCSHDRVHSIGVTGRTQDLPLVISRCVDALNVLFDPVGKVRWAIGRTVLQLVGEIGCERFGLERYSILFQWE